MSSLTSLSGFFEKSIEVFVERLEKINIQFTRDSGEQMLAGLERFLKEVLKEQDLLPETVRELTDLEGSFIDLEKKWQQRRLNLENSEPEMEKLFDEVEWIIKKALGALEKINPERASKFLANLKELFASFDRQCGSVSLVPCGDNSVSNTDSPSV